MILEAWHWFVLALLLVVFLAVTRYRLLLWLTVGSTINGAILWLEPAFPVLPQLLILGLAVGVAFVLAPRTPASEQVQEEAASSEVDPGERVVSPYEIQRYIGRVVVLDQPIVNGFGEVEIDGHRWRVRGVDTPAGQEVEIVAIDGIQRNLLVVEPLGDDEEEAEEA